MAFVRLHALSLVVLRAYVSWHLVLASSDELLKLVTYLFYHFCGLNLLFCVLRRTKNTGETHDSVKEAL